jgi:membrane protein
LITLYLSKSTFMSGYGAIGSLLVLLLWIYYSAQIFLLGAEFTRVFAYARGSRIGKSNTVPRAATRPGRTTRRQRAPS